MQTANLELLKGTLGLLLLKALSRGPRHGHEILSWIRATSDETFLVDEGAIYPALHRLQAAGLLDSDWSTTDNNRKARYYSVTDLGRERLSHEIERWDRYVFTFNRILHAV
jgi:PadR family transcriptional regulator